jgi:hypothetical protein
VSTLLRFGGDYYYILVVKHLMASLTYGHRECVSFCGHVFIKSIAAVLLLEVTITIILIQEKLEVGDSKQEKVIHYCEDVS